MLRPKGYLTLILCFSLAFSLLSSSIVSSFRIDSSDTMATSEVEGEDNSEAEQQEEEQAPDEDQQQGEEQEEDSNIQEPLSGDVPLEDQTLEGDQLVVCSGVVNPETGECEVVQQDGGPEICDNSVDDNLDGNVDETDCKGQEQEATSTLFGSSPSNGQIQGWGLPPSGDPSGPSEETEIPSFGTSQQPSDSDDTTPTSDSSVPSFSPLEGSETEEDRGKNEQVTDEPLAEMGMAPYSPAQPSPPSPSTTSSGPGDLAPRPSPDDPDFCLKEFGRQQITGGKPSPQCMPGQTNDPTTPGQDSGANHLQGQSSPLMVPPSPNQPPNFLTPTTDPLSPTSLPPPEPLVGNGDSQQDGDDAPPSLPLNSSPEDQPPSGQASTDQRKSQDENSDLPGFPVDPSGSPIGFNSPLTTEAISVEPTPILNPGPIVITVTPQTFWAGVVLGILDSTTPIGLLVDVELPGPENLGGEGFLLTQTIGAVVTAGSGIKAVKNFANSGDDLVKVAGSASKDPARVAYKQESRMQRDLRNINPEGTGTELPGTRDKNCGNCFVATRETLQGHPASALPGYATPLTVLEDMFGGKFVEATHGTIKYKLQKAGPGSGGAVYTPAVKGFYKDEPPHVYNVVNQNGNIKYYDGQIQQGSREVAPPKGNVLFLRTD
jgi:Papain fold toxin 1, glutamine deamidase